MHDLRPLHRASLADATALVSGVTGDDLDRPTPCAGWDLRALLAHMVGQHVGFATALRKGDAPAEAYAPIPFDLETWQESVDLLLGAFADADLTAEVLEVELHPTRPLPVSVLVSAQLLDTAVHAWDIATSLGRPYEPTPEIAAAVLAIAEPIPDDARRDEPGAAFAHAVTGEFTSPWERSLALLGRRPLVASATDDFRRR